MPDVRKFNLDPFHSSVPSPMSFTVNKSNALLGWYSRGHSKLCARIRTEQRKCPSPADVCQAESSSLVLLLLVCVVFSEMLSFCLPRGASYADPETL